MTEFEPESWAGYRRLVIEGLDKLAREQNDLRMRVEGSLEKQLQAVKHDLNIYDDKLGELRDRLTRQELNTQSAITALGRELTFKASIWGAVAAMIPVAITILVALLSHFGK